MKKTVTKILSLLVVLSIVFMTSCGTAKTDEKSTETTAAAAGTESTATASQPTYTAAPGSVKKTETVYINSDYYGSPTNVIVSDWLHTDKAEVQVKDTSDLTDISNAKGNEVPQINGESVVWNMQSTDLYYRGSTKKDLPVTIGIKYYLNDVQVAVEDLAGKSGKVKIEINVKNNVYTTKTIGGKAVTVYNPILVIGGMILPDSQFTNVTVTNGQAIGDGSKEIAVIASAPGISDTLGLSEFNIDTNSIKLPSDFTITMDATDFTLGNMYFAAVPFSDLNANIEIPDTVDDIEGSLTTVTELVNSVYALNPDELIKMLQENEAGIKELTTAITKASKLYEENKDLIAVLKKYLTKENVDALEKLVGDLKDADLQKYQELLSNPLFKSFFKDLPTIAGDLETVMPIVEALNSDLEDPTVKASLEKLPDTLNQLSAIIDTVSDNQELIDALLDLASEDNLAKITDIVKAVEAADINSMIDDYSKLADNAEELIARFEAMMDYGNSYKIFSKASKDMTTSTAFIFNTPSITKATSGEDTTKAAGLSEETTEKKGIIDTIKGWF